MAMQINLQLRFTQRAEKAAPENIQLHQLRDEDLMPSVGDDVAISGSDKTVAFRAIRRQIEYRPEQTIVTVVLDTTDEEYIRPQ